MERAVLRSGEPIKNLQHFLRAISYYYSDIPAVVPDGIYSEQTRISVKAFQTYFNLAPTGEVNINTWDKIINIYDQVANINNSPAVAHIFPSSSTRYVPGEQSLTLFTIQAMLFAITTVIKNLGSLAITGVLDSKTVTVIKNIQKLSNIPENGTIDTITWKKISQLYNTTVTKGL